MSAALEQMHISYHPNQDRLLFRIDCGSAGEYRIWLTRRYSELLLGILLDMMDKEGGVQQLASRDETRKHFQGGALKQDLSTPSDPPAGVPLPLGPDGMLAFGLNCTREPGQVALELLPEQGQGIKLNLTPPMLYMMYTMLEQGAAQADWKVRAGAHLRGPVH